MTDVLLLIRSLHIGGAELVVANLARHLDPERFRVRVGTLREPGSIGEELLHDGHPVERIPPVPLPKGELFAFLSLRRYLRRHSIRLVHSHGTAAMVDAAMCRRITPDMRVVHSFHFGNYPDIGDSNRKLESRSWKPIDRLVTVGLRQKEAIRKTYGIPERRLSTVYNGVSAVAPAPDPELLRPFLRTGKVLIGSISTLIEQKGIFDLLEAARALRARTDRALFLIVGDGALRRDLEARRDALGLQDTVHFLGWVKNASATVLPALDVFLQSSLWEAMSMVILEAMAGNKAIVATEVGDNGYVLENRRNGLLVQPGDVNSMVEALHGLVENPELRARYGAAAGADFRNLYTVDIMAERYAGIYEELLRS